MTESGREEPYVVIILNWEPSRRSGDFLETLPKMLLAIQSL